MKTLSQIAALALLVANASWAAPETVVGQPAPPLGLEQMLQGPSGAMPSWDTLRGKVVVLEFWATWCAPCIEAIAHLNELADEFKSNPVQIIAITDENAPLVERFLKRKPMRAWIGLDTDRSMFSAYGVSGIPHTVVVGTNGTIQLMTHPNALSAEILKNVLAGKPPVAPAIERVTDRKTVPAVASGKPPLFEVVLRPTGGDEVGSSSGSSGNKSIRTYTSKGTGHTVFEIALAAYNVSSSRLITNSPLPDGRFDYAVTVPFSAKEQVRRDLLQLCLRTSFGLTGHHETREMDVFLLKAAQPKLELTVSTGGSSMSAGKGRMSAVNTSISSLARSLESSLKIPVIDETSLKERYDFQLKWNPGEESQNEPGRAPPLAQAVREQLGLELVRAKRNVEVVVLEISSSLPPTGE